MHSLCLSPALKRFVTAALSSALYNNARRTRATWLRRGRARVKIGLVCFTWAVRRLLLATMIN